MRDKSKHYLAVRDRKQLVYALASISGMGISRAGAICDRLNTPRYRKCGTLTVNETNELINELFTVVFVK